MHVEIIQENDAEWNVWVTVDEDHDPLMDPFGFIVGQGATRDDAVADAVAELEAAAARLQAPRGTVKERRDDRVFVATRVANGEL